MTASALRTPPPLPPGGLRIVPLGGLGEIGRNMAVFEHRSRLLIVDCGVLFPEDDQPGVDLILPDFSWIRDRLDAVEAIILTHGHEDHIGGVPYLLREKPDIPLVGSTLTLSFVEAKWQSTRSTRTPSPFEPATGNASGPSTVSSSPSTTPSPTGFAVAIRTEAGLVLHTGDFKMDQFSLDGRLTDLRAFARLGEEGVDLLMVDSTNADVPGFTTPERNIAMAIDEVFTKARRRIIAACFASHVHRVQQIIDAADRHERKLAFVGRPMVRNMNLARDLEHLRVPPGVVIGAKEFAQRPPEQASHSHSVKLAEGDTVIMASSLIPGNENAGLIKPRHVMPVHGEARHLRANAELAAETGVDSARVVIARDGTVVDMTPRDVKITGTVQAVHVYVDGATVGELDEALLKDRRMDQVACGRVLEQEPAGAGAVDVLVNAGGGEHHDRRRRAVGERTRTRLVRNPPWSVLRHHRPLRER